MKNLIKRHTISFQHAFDGLIYVLKTQPNYRIHLFLSLLAFVGGIVLRITYFEFLLIIFMITLGLVIETINTAIEGATDAIDTKIREDIKITKDASAAAMLIYAFGALALACIIFIPRIVLLFI